MKIIQAWLNEEQYKRFEERVASLKFDSQHQAAKLGILLFLDLPLAFLEGLGRTMAQEVDVQKAVVSALEWYGKEMAAEIKLTSRSPVKSVQHASNSKDHKKRCNASS